MPCFPEPTALDPTPARRLEPMASWLGRSTWSRAREVRRFYHENLAALPAEASAALCRRLHSARYDDATFELIVGRFLQLRGATELVWEPEGIGGPAGRRVDWRATFPDGVLHVEAMVPVYNAGASETMRRRARLLAVIEEAVPPGWWIMPHRLPRLDENVPIRRFRQTVTAMLAQLPQPQIASRERKIELQAVWDGKYIELAAFPASPGRAGGLGSEGGVSYVDNSELRVAAAWRNRRKREQGRSAPPPALLALRGGFTGADLDDFEMALFGRGVRIGRPPEGVMATDRRPPWAGVLAFPEAGVAVGRDPVLFVSPAYDGAFPADVLRLEVRRLVDGRLEVQPSTDREVLSGMNFAKRG